MRHTIPLGTIVSVEGEGFCYEVCDYHELLSCDKGCHIDHDCYPEPYIHVRPTTRTAFPVSKIRNVFDRPHSRLGKVGRPFSKEEDICS